VRARRGGFTLIEIMAAVTIAALLAALVVPRVAALTSRTLHQRAEQIADSLEIARQRSVLTGIPHRLVLDLDAASYHIEWFATDAEEEGRDAEPPAPLDLRGQSPIPMAAPADARSFRPLPESIGSVSATEHLEDNLSFTGVETPTGLVDSGQASVEFETDGTASYTQIHLDDDSGSGVVLDVLPLADAVEIHDAEQ
jgi:prepilin-type N-terminal cleavage/methylation domain-containing protein